MSLVRNVATPSRDAFLRAIGVDPAKLDVFLLQQGDSAAITAPAERIPLSQAIDLYLASNLPDPASQDASAASRKTYTGVLQNFRAFLEERWSGMTPESWTVDRITPANIEDFVRRPRRDGNPRSAFTINRDPSILSSLLQWLRRHDYLVQNPAEVVDRPREPKLMPVALSASEQEALLDLSRQTTNGLRNHTIIHLVINTGLRAEEVARLRWANFDLPGGWMHVKGKGNKERSIPLRPCVIDSLQYYRNACRNKQVAALGFEDAVFLNEKGARWGHPMSVDALEGMLKPLLMKLGKAKGNMHVLRHTFAVNLLRRGVHIVVISHLLGHELFETTRKYLRVGDPELAREIAEYFPEGVMVPGTMRDLSNDKLKEIVDDVYGGN